MRELYLIGNRKILSLERSLFEAVARQDALGYMRLCEKLGREPEFAELYARGLADFEFNKSREIKPRKEPIQNRYNSFYHEGLKLDERDFDRYIEEKRELLKKYFHKFRNDGKEPVDSIEDKQVGYLFKIMMKYSKKK